MYKRQIFYGRYVDDTFLIYKGTQRQIDNLHSYLNNINDKMRFTLENENNGKLNFLDLTVAKDNNKMLQFNIYSIENPQPVSYTHLDVYKRQVQT